MSIKYAGHYTDGTTARAQEPTGARTVVARMYRSGLRSFDRLAAAIRSAGMAMPMSDGIRYSLKLRDLQKQKRRVFKLYDKRRHDQKAHKNEEIKEAIEYEEMHEISEIEDEIKELHSRRIIEQAERYDLVVPEFKLGDAREESEEDWKKSYYNGDWEKSLYRETWMLNGRARAELRSAIHKEQKERREFWQMKLVWATALAGVIGTLTGLVSALHR
jgi:hypothetical protein